MEHVAGIVDFSLLMDVCRCPAKNPRQGETRKEAGARRLLSNILLRQEVVLRKESREDAQLFESGRGDEQHADVEISEGFESNEDDGGSNSLPSITAEQHIPPLSMAEDCAVRLLTFIRTLKQTGVETARYLVVGRMMKKMPMRNPGGADGRHQSVYFKDCPAEVSSLLFGLSPLPQGRRRQVHRWSLYVNAVHIVWEYYSFY